MGEGVKRKVSLILGIDTKTFGREIGNVQARWNSFSSSIKTTAMQAAGLLVGTGGLVWALKKVGDAFLKPAMGVEGFRMRMTYMYGSAKEASNMLEYLHEEALKTAFGFEELATASTKFRALGFDIKEWIKPLSDLKVISGATLDELIDILGRLQAGSTTMLKRTLIPMGISYIDWKKIAGINMEDSKDMGEAAGNALVAGFRKIIETKFRGVTEEAEKLTSDMISDIGDYWHWFQIQVGEKVLPLVKKDLQKLLNWLEDATKSGLIEEWANKIAEAFRKIYEWGKTNIPKIAEFFGDVSEKAWPFIKFTAENIDKVFIVLVLAKALTVAKELYELLKAMGSLTVLNTLFKGGSKLGVEGVGATKSSLEAVGMKSGRAAGGIASVLKGGAGALATGAALGMASDIYKEYWQVVEKDLKEREKGKETINRILLQYRAQAVDWSSVENMLKAPPTNLQYGQAYDWSKIAPETQVKPLGEGSLPLAKETDGFDAFAEERKKQEQELSAILLKLKMDSVDEFASKRISAQLDLQDTLNKISSLEYLSEQDRYAASLEAHGAYLYQLKMIDDEQSKDFLDKKQEQQDKLNEIELIGLSDLQAKKLEAHQQLLSDIELINSAEVLSEEQKYEAMARAHFEYLDSIRQVDAEEAENKKALIDKKLGDNDRYVQLALKGQNILGREFGKYVAGEMKMRTMLKNMAISTINEMLVAELGRIAQESAWKSIYAAAEALLFHKPGAWAAAAKYAAIAVGAGAAASLASEMASKWEFQGQESSYGGETSQTFETEKGGSHTYGGTVQGQPTNIYISPVVTISGETIFIGSGNVNELVSAIGDVATKSVKQAIEDGEINLS